LCFSTSGAPLLGQATDKKLDDAIVVLRNIKNERLTDEQQNLKAKQIDESWKVLVAAGQKGAERLKQEIQKIESAKEADDFFKLNATAVLILQTKATFYRRLSDECLYEVRDLDKAIKYIGRSRYRKVWV